jgi:hypothetical protein
MNGVGWGTAYSPILNLTVSISQTAPTTMTNISVVSVTPKNITISWPDIQSFTDIGGSPILFYSVEWD